MNGYSFYYEITNYTFNDADLSNPIHTTNIMIKKIMARLNAKSILESFKDGSYIIPPCSSSDFDKVYFKSENDFVMFKLMFEKLL